MNLNKPDNVSQTVELNRKPSIRNKKPPIVKQTKTSFRRMLNANPLIKLGVENNDNNLSKLKLVKPSDLPSNVSGINRITLTTIKSSTSFCSKPSHFKIPDNKPKFDNGTNKVLPATSSRSRAMKYANENKLLSSTRLENCENNKVKVQITKKEEVKGQSRTDKPKKLLNGKPLRRSLSAQHFAHKKTGKRIDPQKCFDKANVSQSLEDVRNILHTADISPITEETTGVVFKTPSAYARRSISQSHLTSTKKSLFSRKSSTPSVPSTNELQKRLSDWLNKRGKSLSSFHHLKCFGIHSKKSAKVDEENKENIEVASNFDKGSYEDLQIAKPSAEVESANVGIIEENLESVAKASLLDLHKLILEGYPVDQCEEWLCIIRQKYKHLENESEYWECRAAIEQCRGNIGEAVECYQTAIIQGAEIKNVDESLDQLLQKFSLLNITASDDKSKKDRERIVRDARKVFKSTIIKFAVQERKLKKKNNVDVVEEKKLVATPVRRSTRLSRSVYTSTPGVLIYSSLKDLDKSLRDTVDFEKNAALC